MDLGASRVLDVRLETDTKFLVVVLTRASFPKTIPTPQQRRKLRSLRATIPVSMQAIALEVFLEVGS